MSINFADETIQEMISDLNHIGETGNELLAEKCELQLKCDQLTAEMRSLESQFVFIGKVNDDLIIQRDKYAEALRLIDTVNCEHWTYYAEIARKALEEK